MQARMPRSSGTDPGSSPLMTWRSRPRATNDEAGARPIKEYRLNRSPCSTDSNKKPSPSPTTVKNAPTGVIASATNSSWIGTTVKSAASSLNRSKLGSLMPCPHQNPGRSSCTHRYGTRLYPLGEPATRGHPRRSRTRSSRRTGGRRRSHPFASTPGDFESRTRFCHSRVCGEAPRGPYTRPSAPRASRPLGQRRRPAHSRRTSPSRAARPWHGSRRQGVPAGSSRWALDRLSSCHPLLEIKARAAVESVRRDRVQIPLAQDDVRVALYLGFEALLGVVQHDIARSDGANVRPDGRDLRPYKPIRNSRRRRDKDPRSTSALSFSDGHHQEHPVTEHRYRLLILRERAHVIIT